MTTEQRVQRLLKLALDAASADPRVRVLRRALVACATRRCEMRRELVQLRAEVARLRRS